VPRTARPAVLRVAAVALAVALVPTLAACGAGADTGTSAQGPSGNGANANQGPMQLRGITLVQGPQGATTATVIGTLVNTGDADDVLLSTTVVSPTGAIVTAVGAGVQGGQMRLPGLSATRVGFNADDHLDVTGLTIAPTAFAQVEFSFQKAGRVVVPVMAVPPNGFYADITAP
jgi:hypothetical protein